MVEMEAVARKYDIGAFVTLTSQTNGEFLFVLPTWSVLQPDADAGGYRFKSRTSTGEHSHEQVGATVHLIMSTMDLCEFFGLQMGKLAVLLKEKMKIDHSFKPMFGTSSPIERLNEPTSGKGKLDS